MGGVGSGRRRYTEDDVREVLLLTSFIDGRGCWIWTGAHDGQGYGVLFARVLSNIPIRAHVAAWRLFRGEISKGFHVHHKCRVRTCVNPEHLEVVSPKDHASRHRELRKQKVA